MHRTMLCKTLYLIQPGFGADYSGTEYHMVKIVVVHYLMILPSLTVGDLPTQKSPNKRNRTGLEIFQPRRAPTTITDIIAEGM